MAPLQHIKVSGFEQTAQKEQKQRKQSSKPKDRGKEIFKMNQAIFAIVLAISLGMTLGSPLTCDKLKDVKEGVENYDLYLVKLKESDNYEDAEYVINLVNQYQATLDQHASNVYEPSVKSQLELTENAGVLHGILSQQALVRVSSYIIIMQTYFMSVTYVFNRCA